jgi:hypothetical protein
MPGSGGDNDQRDQDYSLTGWRLKELERGRTEADVRLDKLEAWKNWVLGAASFVALVTGMFAQKIWSFLTGHS